MDFFVYSSIPAFINPIAYNQDQSIIAYPNPFHNQTQFIFNNITSPIDIKFYDISGRMVQQVNNVNKNIL